MPAAALRVEEPAVPACIKKYARELCHRWRVPRLDVDDVVQEVLTEIHASLASFHPDKGDFIPWMEGIAWKVVRKRARAAKQYAQRFSEYHPNIEDHPAPDPSPERYVQREQAKCLIAQASQTGCSQQMQVFVLHVVDGMSHVEIGEQLNIPVSTSQKRYQRARDHLARCLHGKVFSAMPLDAVGCNESTASNVGHSRWSERSHYAVQLGTLIMAVLLSFSMKSTTTRHESTMGVAMVPGTMKNTVMYDSAKPTVMHDEPAVHRDAPSVKPEPASLPSVRAVSVPTRAGDKPSPGRPTTWLPPYKHVERPSANRPHVW